ncbi:MAG: hypothetical protein ACFFCW_36680 [Candidatus Hodarchaeota archaeon]
MANRLILSVLLLIVVIIIIIIWILWPIEKRPPILLTNGSGVETTEFQLHDSILFNAIDLSPRTGYDIQVLREDGTIITELVLSTDAQGRIPQTVLWYNVGIAPCPPISTHAPALVHRISYDVRDFDYSGMGYNVKILHNGELIREMNFQIAEALLRPVLYASDWRGCPKSGFLIGEEDVWVVGKNFPKGSIIRIWAVPASSDWHDGDQLLDKTKQYNNLPPPVFELRATETDFIKKLWPRDLTSLGSYDIVAEVITYEVGDYHPMANAQVQDFLSYMTYSGFVIQRRPGAAEPLEGDIAGSAHSPYTFRNTFLTNENVYVGVDPCLQPSYVGQTANIYIVPDQNDAWWTVSTSVNLAPLDVTGTIETITVGGVCGNCWKTLAWSAPLTLGEYDVILDFNRDGFYTPGQDLIDSLEPIGFVVSEVRVDIISFNYSGSGAITIRNNINKRNISAPEYYSANHIVKPAAWTMGGSHSVQVEFKAVPAVSSIQIWAENGLGGLNSSGSPVTVSFSDGTGQATFSVNSVPSSIGKHLFYWDWNYKNVNGASTPETYMGETGEHIVYTVHSMPNAPMATPWLDVLEYATNWASGETTEAGVVDKIVNGIYNSGMVYDGYRHHTPYDYTTFYLNDVFTELRTPGFTVEMDCRDCANFFHVLTNALGFNHQYLVISPGFDYEPMLPMGVTWTSSSSCVSGYWNFHQVGWCGSHVADGSTKLNCTSSYGSLVTAVCDITDTNYINLLTNDTTGAADTGICSPQE